MGQAVASIGDTNRITRFRLRLGMAMLGLVIAAQLALSLHSFA